ncbi:MAG: rod shape-determining protein RodA [Actinomycetota bacterium]
MVTITAGPLAVARRRAGETSPLHHVDFVLLMLPFAISGLGLLMVYSSTKARLERNGVSELYFVQRQGLAIVLGIAVMAVCMAVDYRKLRDLWALVYVTILPLLAGVLLIGASRKGAQAWFDIGPFQFQPSEIAKLGVIGAVAGYCHLHRGDLDAWRLCVAVTIAVVPMGLVLAQNDLGSAAVIGVCAGTVLIVAGIRPQHAAVLSLLAITAVGAVIVSGTLDDYKLDRLTGFIDQSSGASAADQTATEYNTEQAKLAIAAGGFDGSGLFQGTQAQLGYVPEQHTDFIFSVVGEELGFVGGASLIALYALLAWRLWRVSLLSSDFFGTLVTMGVLAMFAFQVFENIGMTMGIMPITGLPLPFMSYGGSAVIASFAAVGLALNVHMRRFS